MSESSVLSSSSDSDEVSYKSTVYVLANMMKKYKLRCKKYKKRLDQQESTILELGKRKLLQELDDISDLLEHAHKSQGKASAEMQEEILTPAFDLLSRPSKRSCSNIIQFSSCSTASQQVQTDKVSSEKETHLEAEIQELQAALASKDSKLLQLKADNQAMTNKIKKLEQLLSAHTSNPTAQSRSTPQTPLLPTRQEISTMPTRPDTSIPQSIAIMPSVSSEAIKSTIRLNEGIFKGSAISGRVPWGRGSLLYNNGDCYDGNFIAGKPHGVGLLTTRDGKKIYGSFMKGVPHGYVTMVYPQVPSFNGVMATQESALDKIGGQSQAQIFEGHFFDGQMNGAGRMKFLNLDIYEGQFVNNKIEGRGRLVFSSGDVYDGEFKNGLMHGTGFFIPKDLAFISIASYQDGKLSGISERYEHRNSTAYFKGLPQFTMKLTLTDKLKKITN